MRDVTAKYPEFPKLWRNQYRREVERKFGEAIESLGLAEDAVPKLKELLVERETSAWDAEDAATHVGIKRGTQELTDAIVDAQAEVDEKIAAYIGAEKYARLRELAGAQKYIKQANNLSSDIAASSTPLSSTQTRELAVVLGDVAEDGAQASDKTGTLDRETWMRQSDGRLLDRAGKVLSKEQLKALRQTLAEQNEMREIYREFVGDRKNAPVVFTN